MSGPVDTVTSHGVPTEPGFYWRRMLHFGDSTDGEAGWRWAVCEVYRPYGAGPESPLMTNGYLADDRFTWGPRVEPPSDGTRDDPEAAVVETGDADGGSAKRERADVVDFIRHPPGYVPERHRQTLAELAAAIERGAHAGWSDRG